MTTYIPGAIRQRCYVRDCERTSDQRHHITYDAVGDWALVPLCPECHRKLHALHEHVKGRISLELFSFRFIMSPATVERRVQGVARLEQPTPEPLDARQLSFADQLGPSGEYWRALMADEIKDPEAPKNPFPLLIHQRPELSQAAIRSSFAL